MKTGLQIMKEQGMDTDKEFFSEEDFNNKGISILVQCSLCAMTLAFPSLRADEQGYIYCSSCSKEMEE